MVIQKSIKSTSLILGMIFLSSIMGGLSAAQKQQEELFPDSINGRYHDREEQGIPDDNETSRAKVYAVFFSISSDLSNDILETLKKKCGGIEFVGQKRVRYDGKESYKNNNLVLQDIEIEKQDLDGLMLFCGSSGFCDRRYMETGLPTIIVDCSPSKYEQVGYKREVYRGQQIAFKNAEALAEKSGTKFITATYPVSETEEEFFVEQQLNNLKKKVHLFKVIKDLKNSKIITIQDHKGFNRIDQGTYDGPITQYDLTYPDKLEENFGIELIVVNSGEVKQELGKIDRKNAENIADTWIKEATEVKNVERHDIVRAAEFYLANKRLVNKYNADGITFESATLSGELQAVYPLTIMELSKDYIPACCQSHIDCLVTQLIGNYFRRGTGFAGDLLNDWAFEPIGDHPENVIIVAHCGAQITPHGHDRIPYFITDHYIQLHQEKFNPGNTPAATTVDWPSDEDATISKVDVYRKMISVFTGTVLDGESLYKDFLFELCRNKIVVEIDRPEDCYMLPSNPVTGNFRRCDTFDSEHRHWGGHQVAFYGNLRQEFRNLGSLLGMDVVEGK